MYQSRQPCTQQARHNKASPTIDFFHGRVSPDKGTGCNPLIVLMARLAGERKLVEIGFAKIQTAPIYKRTRMLSMEVQEHAWQKTLDGAA
jgi:hypothetical protein